MVPALPACSRVGDRPTPNSPVPWLALPPAHKITDAPILPPDSPPPVPPGTPACTAGQLEGLAIQAGIATGHTYFRVLLRNRDAVPCWLEGYPDIDLRDPADRLLAQVRGASGRAANLDGAPATKVLLAPGTAALVTGSDVRYRGVAGQAYMSVEWFDCARRRAASILIALPDAGKPLAVPFVFQGPGSPACPIPGTCCSLTRGPWTPSGVDFNPHPDYIPVAIDIEAPSSAARGHTLVYSVKITNQSDREYRLDPCPDYSESVARTRCSVHSSSTAVRLARSQPAGASHLKCTSKYRAVHEQGPTSWAGRCSTGGSGRPTPLSIC